MGIDDGLLDCAICPNLCRSDCPVVQATANEAHSPAQKARLVQNLATGALPETPGTTAPLYACAGCGACAQRCPFTGFELAAALRARRRPETSPPGVAELLATLRSTGSPFGRPPSLPADECPASPDALYFAGCAERVADPAGAAAAVTLLRRGGWTVARVPSREICCGHAAACLGDRELAAGGEAALRALLDEVRPRRLVVGCPECHHTLGRLDLGLEVEPALRAIHRLHREGRLSLDPAGPGEVVYHDPCIWARKADLRDEPRELLAAVGLEVRRPERSGLNTDCCGAGDLLSLHSPRIGRRVALRRLADLGPGPIVTSCPHCRRAFREAGAGEVRDLAALLAGGGGSG